MKDALRTEMESRKFPKSVITTALGSIKLSENPDELTAVMLEKVQQNCHPKEIVKASQPAIRKHLEKG